MQVEEVAQPFTTAEANRQLTQPAMAEVEHPKLAEIPDTFRNLGQVVVGQDERLQVGPEPYLIRYDAQPLPPKGKMWFQLAHRPR